MAMGELSAFVGQNYFWILVIGIILIMALIGFIADKKNLVMIQKKPKEKKDNTDETKELLNHVEEKSLADAIYGNANGENQQEPVVEDSALNTPLESNTELSNVTLESANDLSEGNVATTEVEVPKTINGMEIVDFESVVSNENDVPSELYAPLVETSSENKEATEVVAQPTEADVPSELYAPLEGSVEATNEAIVEPVEAESEQQVVSEVQNESANVSENVEQSPIEVDLPDLNSVDNQATEASDSDDIWKF